MKVKIAGEKIVTLTQAMTEYTPTADAQETDITCVADVDGNLAGKYFKLYAANNSTKHCFYYTIPTAAQVSTYTTIANSSSSLSGKYFSFYDNDGKSYVPWFNVGEKEINTLSCGTAAQTDMTGEKEKNTLTCGTAAQTDMTGEKEKNTLTCGTAAQTDMTGTKEVNTIVAEADVSGSLNNTTFHFFSLDGNNGTKSEYYVWFNVDSGGADPQEPLGTPIEVAISANDVANDVATAVRSAINTYGADVIVSGSSADIVITSDYFGVAEAAADGWASPTGWSSFTRTVSGVDITAGEYFTFTVGVETPVNYYAWFNATGGSAADTAPSLEPTVSGTGIQVDHAFDATNANMGLALRTALDTLLGSGGLDTATITGATTDCIIEDNEYGLGVAAAEHFTDVNFSVARTNTGVDITDGEYFTFVSDGTTYYAWFNATGGSSDNEAPSSDPSIPAATGIQVDHAFDATNANMGLALRTAIDAAVSTVTVTGATTDCIIEENSYGLGTAATESFTNANFTVAETNAGVAVTAGEYFIFYSGLSASATKYYAWFNATGGSSDDEAPSSDPSVAAATGIQVDHAFDANAEAMGLALRTALSAAGLDGVVISGATTDCIVTNSVNGEGIAATEHFTDVNFTVARTNTGVTGSSQPTGFPSGTTYIEVDLNTDDTDTAVGAACRTALNAVSDVTDKFTITGSTTSIIITCDITGALKTATVGDSGFSVDETVSGWTGNDNDDPNISGWTSHAVTILPNDNSTTGVTEKTKDVIHAVSDFSATRSTSTISVVNAANGECSDPEVCNSGFTMSVTTNGVTGIVSPSGYKIFEIVGTQPDLTYYNGGPIVGKTKNVSFVVPEEDIEYIQEGF